jgi:hypothetical protein
MTGAEQIKQLELTVQSLKEEKKAVEEKLQHSEHMPHVASPTDQVTVTEKEADTVNQVHLSNPLM